MSEKQEKYCVLGATSFGGRATLESLLKEKHEVLAIARRETPKKPFAINNYGSKKLKMYKNVFKQHMWKIMKMCKNSKIK